MADVARLAGVSHQTVSRVVNGQTNLRPATRERVAGGDPAARLPAATPPPGPWSPGRSGTIGVIGSKSGFWGPSTVHRAIQAAGREAGYFVSSANLQSLTRDRAHRRHRTTCATSSVEGIVLIAATDDASRSARAQVDRRRPGRGRRGRPRTKAPWTVGVDQVAGAELGTRAPASSSGHQDILHLGRPDVVDRGASAACAAGRNAMYAAGLRPLRHLEGDWSARSGYEAGREVAGTPRRHRGLLRQRPDGPRAAAVARPRPGRSVPDDVSVVGFDDIPEAAYLIPPLTTVRQDFAAVGPARHRDPSRRDRRRPPRPHRLIGPELVVRVEHASPPRKEAK